MGPVYLEDKRKRSVVLLFRTEVGSLKWLRDEERKGCVAAIIYRCCSFGFGFILFSFDT